ncbi:MAG: carbonic anhydrase family protein [Bacteroidota bacterium]
MKHLFFLIILISVFSCSNKKKENNEADTGNLVPASAPDAFLEKEQGYILPGMNHGLIQSPINIVTKNLDEGSHEITVHYNKTENRKVANLGHTIQVNFDNDSYIEYKGKRYTFHQFHFHTPSEHHIDGLTYPMEMHMVHQAEDNESQSHYVVVAALFKEGERNAFIDEFLNYIPEQEQDSNPKEQTFIDVNDLIHSHFIHGCYHYQGSLTTPPYTESVHWAIMKKIYEASPEQIEKINMIEGNNARHIQALYGRSVEVD